MRHLRRLRRSGCGSRSGRRAERLYPDEPEPFKLAHRTRSLPVERRDSIGRVERGRGPYVSGGTPAVIHRWPAGSVIGGIDRPRAGARR
jgi:hypothetical protein